MVAFRGEPGEILWVAGSAVGLFAVYFLGVLFFALRNPGAALLEGTELLRWQQSELAAKDLNRIPSVPALPESEDNRESPESLDG